MKAKKPVLNCHINTSANSIGIVSFFFSLIKDIVICFITGAIVSIIIPATGYPTIDISVFGNIGQYIKIAVGVVCLVLLCAVIIYCFIRNTLKWPFVVAIIVLFVIALIMGVPFENLYKLSNQNGALLSYFGIVTGVLAVYITKSKRWGVIIALSLAFCSVMITIQMAYARVPGVVGKTFEDAETILLEKDFNVKIMDGETIEDDYNQWIVIAQAPSKNAIHNRYTPVVLTIDRGTADIDGTGDNVGVTWDDVPILSAKCSEPIPLSFKSDNSQFNSRFGPNDNFAEAGAFGNGNTRTITAYYKENEMVLTEIKPIPGSLGTNRWVYVPFDSLAEDKREQIMEIHGEMKYINGKINQAAFTYWEPKEKNEKSKVKCDRYELNKDTPVRVYFQENDFAFVEFTAVHKKDKTTDLVRLWVYKKDIDLVS